MSRANRGSEHTRLIAFSVAMLAVIALTSLTLIHNFSVAEFGGVLSAIISITKAMLKVDRG